MQVMQFFELESDYDLNLMKPDQTLFDLTSKGLLAMKSVLQDCKPDTVIVQGDTTTALAGALAAFYSRIPIAHVEAGLRSQDNYSPFPEEVNRRIISILTHLHFAPTQRAVENLKKENIQASIYMTGNTVVDALLWAVEKIRKNPSLASGFDYLDAKSPVVLITGHRRESFGKPFENICEAILDLANRYPDFQFVYPVHLNPNVQRTVNKMLGGRTNIHLIKPLDYPHLVWLMDRSYFVLTDSGGIQEEAPTLGKPVLVMRDVTEREEGIAAGTALLVGTHRDRIVQSAVQLIEDKAIYQRMSKATNPYGAGDSARKITDIILNEPV